MKFSAQIALACFSAGALANVAPRALSDFQNVLTNVQGNTKSLDSAINGFTGDTAPVQAAATTLVDTISSGNSQLSGQPVLSLGDTFILNSQVNSLKTDIQTLANDLKAKRSAVISSGNCGLVRENIVAINTATDTLTGTIESKVDPAAKAVAEKQKQDIQAMLNDCTDYYSTANCA